MRAHDSPSGPSSASPSASVSESRWCVDITCSQDGLMHQIDDVVLTAAIGHGFGRFSALCGRFVVAASMTEPPGPPCPLCATANP